jgi:hypothetical protein
MTPAEAQVAATMAANLATEAANNAQQAAQESVQAALAAAEAVRAAQAAQATASSSTRNYVAVPQGSVRSRRGFPRLSKIFKKKTPILYRMSGTRRRQLKPKPRQTNKRKSRLPTVAVVTHSRSPSSEAMPSSRRQRTSHIREYALPVPLIGAVPMDTTLEGGRRTDRKKTKKQKKHRRK